MGERRSTTERRSRRPAHTPEGRENQLISLAYDEAERQLREGTASSQIITQLLKFGSTREKVEQERLQNENLLMSARIAQIEQSGRIEAMYEEALNAMRSYSGQEVDEYYDQDETYR